MKIYAPFYPNDRSDARLRALFPQPRAPCGAQRMSRPAALPRRLTSANHRATLTRRAGAERSLRACATRRLLRSPLSLCVCVRVCVTAMAAEDCFARMSRMPILVILGATGSGKSRLGIELAQRFSSEVISADSMQVYKGLDILTAKVTPAERKMAIHHMVDEIDPLANYCVMDFRNKALKIINDLMSRRKMPIIVGGTNYYIESLLWQILVEDPKVSYGSVDIDARRSTTIKISRDVSSSCTLANAKANKEPKHVDNVIAVKRRRATIKEDTRNKDSFTLSKTMRYDDDKFTNAELYRKLVEVDPDMARRLHPNNRRKVIRSLQVFEDHGTTHSEILKAQRMAGGSGLGGPLRYPESIILWLRCDQKILDERLNVRVDTMLEAGLVKELLNFHARYNEERLKTNTSPDYTKGIFQSIGFKEFHNYLVLPEDERNSEKGEQLLKQGIVELKMVTRRYARRQERWVKNRLIRRVDRQVPHVYGLDCSNVDEWNTRVLEAAVKIVEARLRNEEPRLRPLNENIESEKKSDSSNEESRWCETCERVLIGELQWKAHIEGAKHKRRAHKKKQLEKEALQNEALEILAQ